MSNLGERIKYIRDDLFKLNQSAFAEMLGFSRVATISDYEKNKRSPDIETLCKIASLGPISLDWLLTGKGEALQAPQKPEEIKESAKTLYCEQCLTMEVYDIDNAESAKDFPKGAPIETICIPQSDVKEGIIAIKIKGDSMGPTIVNNAIVGIDRKDRRLVSGKLYAVWLSYEGVAIKRVFVSPDRITLKTDNAAFPETTIPISSMSDDFIIGKVAWVHQRY